MESRYTDDVWKIERRIVDYLFFKIIPVVIGAGLYVCSDNRIACMMTDWPCTLSVDGLLFVVNAGFYLWISGDVRTYVKRRLFRNWFDIGDSYLGKHGWREVRRIIDGDPVFSNVSKFYALCGIRFQELYVVVVYFSIVFVVFSYPVVKNILSSSNVVENVKSEWGVFVGFSAVVAFFYNSRVKSHVEGRMKWVDTLKDEMSHFFGAVGSLGDVDKNNDYFSVERTVEYSGHRANATETIKMKSRFELMSKLELMLNPNEKEHRSLMALMRMALGYSHLEVDRNVYSKLGFHFVVDSDIGLDDGKYTYVFSRVGSMAKVVYVCSSGEAKYLEYDELLSKVFRLANVVVKVEWERAKNAG